MGQSHHERVSDVRKIAVLRANALGDFIFILPAMEALRATYPNAEIVLLGKQWHSAFLRDRPGPIDRVVVVPPYGGVSEKSEYMGDANEHDRFFTTMLRERFDLALQVHGGGRYSNPFVTRLGAKMTVGLKTPDAVPLDRWMPYIYFQHEVLRYKEAVSLIGATTGVLEPRLSIIERDRVEAESVLMGIDKPMVALHPGASESKRCWPTERFAAVGDMLAAQGMQVVVTGTQGEESLVEGVIHAMQAPALNYCNRLSLSGFAGLLSRCRVVVSNDTGPLHLAAAVGAATVGLYGCFNFINAGPFTRTRHRSLISWQTNCPLCGIDNRDSCEHAGAALAGIVTKDVIEAALDLVQIE